MDEFRGQRLPESFKADIYAIQEGFAGKPGDFPYPQNVTRRVDRRRRQCANPLNLWQRIEDVGYVTEGPREINIITAEPPHDFSTGETEAFQDAFIHSFILFGNPSGYSPLVGFKDFQSHIGGAAIHQGVFQHEIPPL